MPELTKSFVVIALFVGLLLLTRPLGWRVFVRLARPIGNWAMTHFKRAEEWDSDERDLWLMEKRRRLCADLRRVEHLLATDTWMSATRQRGNRIAYDQLVEDLRQTPDVFPTIFQTQTFNASDEFPAGAPSTGLATIGSATQGRTVEILEIGWGRRRR